MSTADPSPRRGRLLATAEGTLAEAFGLREWLLVVGIAVIWGSSFLWMELGLEGLRPGVIVMSRVALGAVALALFPRARRSVEREDLPRIGLLGLVWMAFPLSLFPIAQQWIDSAVAGMVNGAMPLTTAAWATLLLGRLPGRVQQVGLAVGFAGVAAIAWPEVVGSRATALGVGLVVLAVILYGLAANLAVPLQQRYGALPVLLRAQLTALMVVVPFGLVHLPGSAAELVPLLAMIPLGVLSTGVAFAMMSVLVGRVGGTRGSVPIYLVPVVAVILGVWLRDETVAAAALVGTGLVIVGAWLTSRHERRGRARGAPSPPSQRASPAGDRADHEDPSAWR